MAKKDKSSLAQVFTAFLTVQKDSMKPFEPFLPGSKKRLKKDKPVQKQKRSKKRAA